MTEISGPIEKYRFIFRISDKGECGAKPDPAAEPRSHEHRKAPAINS
jgi:hypothetical protein